jgi:DNA-binding NarL/FixJ family response regulator
MKQELIRIVLVDDHQVVRETWKLLLQQEKRFEIIAECSSGAEAISCAQSMLPDIMLMDVNMSPVNGFEATRKICKLVPGTRIIGVSINNQPTYARNMMKLGAKGYVTKNSGSDEMIRAIIEVHKGNLYICEEVRSKMEDP